MVITQSDNDETGYGIIITINVIIVIHTEVKLFYDKK